MEKLTILLKQSQNINHYNSKEIELTCTDYIYGLAMSLVSKTATYNEKILACVWATNALHYWYYNDIPLVDLNGCYSFSFKSLECVDEFVMDYINDHYQAVLVTPDETVAFLHKFEYDNYLSTYGAPEDIEAYADVCDNLNLCEEEYYFNIISRKLLIKCSEYLDASCDSMATYIATIKTILDPYLVYPMQADYGLQLETKNWQIGAGDNYLKDLLKKVLVFYNYHGQAPSDCGIYIPTIQKIFHANFATHQYCFSELDQAYWNYHVEPKFK